MKYKFPLLVLSLLFTSSFAQAALTKQHVIYLGAEAVYNNGDAARVQSCGAIKDRKTLMACVAENTNFEGDIAELPSNAVVKGMVELSYFDNTGDCRLRLEIDANNGVVTEFDTWHCY